jgi:hypothetical protein
MKAGPDQDLLHACLAHIEDPQPGCRFQAARSAALLGGGLPAATALEPISKLLSARH